MPAFAATSFDTTLLALARRGTSSDPASLGRGSAVDKRLVEMRELLLNSSVEPPGVCVRCETLLASSASRSR
jgi:hypothetical protein